jgi:hypothetical protein
MLLAFPSDYWADEHIRGAVKDFGALISWDKEISTYGALIAKIRVVDLHHIPHSCVISAGNEWAAESWSVPVFILSQKLLGALPADEDQPPADGSTPHPMPNVAFQMPAHAQPAAAPAQQANDAWPNWQPAPQAHDQNDNADPHLNFIGQNLHFLGVDVDLNVVPHNIDIDLNNAPHHLDEADFLELNDLLNPVIQNNGHPPVVVALAAPNLPQQAPAENDDMMQVEEIHSDLTVTISSDNTLSDDSDDSVNGVPPVIQQHNLQVGMVLMPDLPIDPVMQLGANIPSDRTSFYFSKEGTTAWSSFFKPDGIVVNTVTVPAQWADFFTAKLLTPEDFDWAKNLLQSRIWQILGEMDASTDSASRTFVLPRHCPSQNPPVCTLSLASTEVTQGFLTPQAPRRTSNAHAHSSTSALIKKAKNSKIPLDCSEVRRSTRIKALHKGYKARTCFDKNCLACAAVAPPVKRSVVKNLCAKFNISEEEEDEDASPQDNPAVPAGDKQTKNKKSNNADKKKNPKKK